MQDKSFGVSLCPKIKRITLYLVASSFVLVLYTLAFPRSYPDPPPNYPCRIVTLSKIELLEGQQGTDIVGRFDVFKNGAWARKDGRLIGTSRTIREARLLISEKQVEGELRGFEDESGVLFVFARSQSLSPLPDYDLPLFTAALVVMFYGFLAFLLFTPKQILLKAARCSAILTFSSITAWCFATVATDWSSTSGWQEAPCQLEVLQAMPPGFRWNTSYQYQVGDSLFQGVGTSGRDSEWMLWLSPKIDELKMNGEGRCFVNPENREQATLQRYDMASLLLGIHTLTWLYLLVFSGRMNRERKILACLGLVFTGALSFCWMLPGFFGALNRGELDGFSGLLMVEVGLLLVCMIRGSQMGLRSLVRREPKTVNFLARVVDNRPDPAGTRGMLRSPSDKPTIGQALDAIRVGKKSDQLVVSPLIRKMFERNID